MRFRSSVALLALLFSGCGLVLDLQPAEDASVPRFDGSFDAGPDGASCVPSNETCNGEDDDCDGRIDELAGADDRLGCGLLEQCVEGACACAAGTVCAEACVDLLTDPDHCGACDNACEGACVDGVCCGPEPPLVDVLLVVDDSNSMAEEQALFGSLLHSLVTALEAPPRADLPPLETLHFGVVSTDMGNAGVPLPTCTTRLGDDGVLQTAGRGSGCASTYPSFLDFQPGVTPTTDAQEHLRCVGNLGTGGCGFEQPLEASLKALTPSTSPIAFFEGTGHADGANAGFLRDGSVLVVATLADEDDCSVADPELYVSGGIYEGDLNTRCVRHEVAALHPVRRYVDGLSQVRDPSDIVYVVVGGIPPDLVGEPASAILADDRMTPTLNATSTTVLPSCTNASTGAAAPPRRLVQTAAGLEAGGATAVFGTVCAGDLGMPLRPVLDAIADRYVDDCPSL